MICIVLFIAVLTWFYIPEPLAPRRFSAVTCSMMMYGREQFCPDDEQTVQLAELLQNYKMTPTLRQYSDITLLYDLRIVLSFHGVPGKTSSQISGVTVFNTEDGEHLYIAQSTGFPRGIAYKIHNGQQLYEEVRAMIAEWQ